MLHVRKRQRLYNLFGSYVKSVDQKFRELTGEPYATELVGSKYTLKAKQHIILECDWVGSRRPEQVPKAGERVRR